MAAYDVDRLLSTARERLAAAQTAEKDNRVEAETDLMFKVGGKGQWNADAYQERKDKNRPALTINQLDVFSNQVNNEIRQSQPALHISPKRDATADTAEVLEGMARAIQYETDAELGYDMASRYAVDSGFGCLRMVTEISENVALDRRVVFWSRGEPPEAREIHLKVLQTVPIRIVRADSSDPRLRATLREIAPGREYLLQVRVADTSAPLKGEVVLVGDSPAGSPQTFTVRARVK